MGIHLKRTPAVIGRDEAATNRPPAAGLACQRSVEKFIHPFFQLKNVVFVRVLRTRHQIVRPSRLFIHTRTLWSPCCPCWYKPRRPF